MNKGEIGKPKHSIIWKDIYNRLQTAASMLEDNEVIDSEQKARILKNRAMMLAQEVESTTRGPTIKVVEFTLANEKYGLESVYISEVIAIKDVTAIPSTPSFVAGVINYRSRILSVIDLKKLFDLPEKGLGELNKVLIMHSEKMDFGILADAIIGVRDLPVNELSPAPDTFFGFKREYIKGLTLDQVVILNAATILSDPAIVTHDEID